MIFLRFYRLLYGSLGSTRLACNTTYHKKGVIVESVKISPLEGIKIHHMKPHFVVFISIIPIYRYLQYLRFLLTNLTFCYQYEWKNIDLTENLFVQAIDHRG